MESDKLTLKLVYKYKAHRIANLGKKNKQTNKQQQPKTHMHRSTLKDSVSILKIDNKSCNY